MRLSDAIALGRTLVEPRDGSEWFTDGSGCARGMALEAVGKRIHSSVSHWENFGEEWPWTRKMNVRFPCTSCKCISIGRVDSVSIIITHLFDSHVMEGTWTLDQLIDWVRSVEPAEETPTEQTPTAVEMPVCQEHGQ